MDMSSLTKNFHQSTKNIDTVNYSNSTIVVKIIPNSSAVRENLSQLPTKQIRMAPEHKGDDQYEIEEVYLKK